ncbi:MAG: Cys-tRNA(Pro) deacylase [Clostridia bacterium]|nr:Cys-tRNA(Pro) deacylase [Clostridia bacterium]
MGSIKTNAIRLLDGQKITYALFEYDTSDGLLDGVSVAHKTGRNIDQVFKTLVTVGASKEHYVFCVPVEMELDLKKAAKACGEKKVEMILAKEITPTTGYIKGGCSPIGMKKKFKTYIDETCLLYDKICVSGGKVGLQLEIGVDDLMKVVDGKTFDLTKEPA